MANMITAAIALGFLAPANAGIVWDSTFGKSPARRLALGLVNSHSNASDADCIVGGYDPDHPTRIYVGGPCSLIVNGTPQTGFRWVVMETVDASLVSSDGSEADMIPYTTAGSTFQHAAEHTEYAEAGAGMTVHFSDTNISDASLFLSTTSYLAKASFGFTKNNFVVGVDSSNASKKEFINDVCVKPCAGTLPVDCTTCPSENIAVTPGMYKYSILAAAYDNGNTASTKGWQLIKSTYGSGTPKMLRGHLNVYQAIDFTNMNADTLTIQDGATGTTYAAMDACEMTTFKSVANPTQNCTVYTVVGVTVESAEWQGTYAFPGTFNVGDWNLTNGVLTPTMGGTRAVVIRCVKPSPANLAAAGMTTTSKAVYLEYKFDVTGIEAQLGQGKYMVYDPTITSGTGSRTGGGSTGAASTSSGRTACEPTVAFFAMTFLAALSSFM